MYLYIGCGKYWVMEIIPPKIYDAYYLRCKLHPFTTVPFSREVDRETSVQLCDENGFRTGKVYKGDAAISLMEHLIGVLAVEKLNGEDK